jgi:hypothetical protein
MGDPQRIERRTSRDRGSSIVVPHATAPPGRPGKLYDAPDLPPEESMSVFGSKGLVEDDVLSRNADSSQSSLRDASWYWAL